MKLFSHFRIVSSPRAYHTFSPKLTPSAREKPTPVVLVGGEFMDSSMWVNLKPHLQSQGYGGMCVPWSSICSGTIDDSVANLRKLTLQLIPPIMVTHSMSSFIAQKYLESHALSGLILINPMAGNVRTGQWPRKLVNHIDASMQTQNFLHGYYGIPSEVLADTPINEVAKTKKLMQSLNCDPKQSVHLEKGVVPTMVITTAGHENLLGKEIFDRSMNELIAQFAVDSQHWHHLSGESSRCPLIGANTEPRNQSQELVTVNILNWMEQL